MQTHLIRLVPEFIVLGMAFLLLIVDFFRKRGGRKFYGLLGIAASVAAGIALYCQAAGGDAFFGLYIQDNISFFFKWLILLITAIVLYIVTVYEERLHGWRGEFYSLTLFASAGMMLLSSVNDFISFYVTLEYLAVCLYVLAAFNKRDSSTVEGGLKYLVTGALASGFLLYGISFIYGASGHTGFNEVAAALKTAERNGFLTLGVTLVVIGLTFKIASIPFHVWSPDVYQGAPTPVTALLAAGSKAAGFVVVMRVLFTALAPVKGEWFVFVSVLSGATLLFGNLAAMPQKDIKRLIAYAGIGSAGYLLMAVAASSAMGAGAIMFYLITYAFGILSSFLAIVVFSNATGSYSIESYAGLAKRSPVLAATLFIGLLSVAGIPPLGGFVAKFYIIAAAMKEGMLVLAVIGVVMAIVSMYYFLLVIKSVYLRPAKDEEPIRVAPATKAVLILMNAATVVLGVYPGPFTDWVMRIGGTFFVK